VESLSERTHGAGDPCHFRNIERLEPAETAATQDSPKPGGRKKAQKAQECCRRFFAPFFGNCLGWEFFVARDEFALQEHENIPRRPRPPFIFVLPARRFVHACDDFIILVLVIVLVLSAG